MTERRLIKWLGDPPVLRKNGWSVANWRYENRRVIALPGFVERVIDKSLDPRLTRSYHWDKDLPNYVLPMELGDARVLLERCPHEFRDVTEVLDPSTVQHTPVILDR
jgi:hypothetical protein